MISCAGLILLTRLCGLLAFARMLVMSERNFKAQELKAVRNRYNALLEVTESYSALRPR
jgi:hypothetical protein